MKLYELFKLLTDVQIELGVAPPKLCGGVCRDKFMNRLDNIADIDITNGEKSIDYLSQEFAIKLKKQFDVTRKTMEDGHSTIFIGNLKMDFSSNFMVPGIDNYLHKLNINNPSNMQKEMFSRDFTCNALLMDLDLKHISDPTKRGFKDIKEKTIRTCLSPNITLTSNRNRVCRAIYLACKLEFDLDPNIITFVSKNPQVAKISTDKSMKDKLNEAFAKDADRASHLITQMNLWNYIPITPSIYPYYNKRQNAK